MSLNPSFSDGQLSNVFDPLSMDVWDSFRDFPFPSSWCSSWALSSGLETFEFASPLVGWKETPEAHVFTVDIPGVKKEEVKVQIIKDYRVLQISGERSVENEELKGSSGHRVERSSGKFMRRCTLTETAKVDEAKASIKNGVLTITVPKVERMEPDIKIIEITD